MKPLATSLAALCLATGLLATAVPAQEHHATRHFTDPANLGDEQVKARDGRELPVDQGARGLEQMLRRLNTRASVLNIVAHPDDEDGGMLTLYSRGMGARVADMSLTRGEGGQNAMTADFEDALGLLRTQELLACDRYSGIDQFFGTEADFGFSKTKEEAFAKWTHERLLYDVVRAIRIYRPLVITSTWIGGVTDGHGQHQASGEIAQEAFVAAGDPKVFPELTAEGILPWQPLKIYARVPTQSISEKGLFDYATGQYTKPRFQNYVTGEVSATAPSVDVIVHEGATDSLLADADGTPRSYVQFARMGLAQQKSQMGPGIRPPGAGVFDVSYHLYGSHVEKETRAAKDAGFFDGIDTSLNGILSLQPKDRSLLNGPDWPRFVGGIEHAQKAFRLDNPAACAPDLADSLKALDSLIFDLRSLPEYSSMLHELRVKHAQLEEALALALKLQIRATTDSEVAQTGSSPKVHVEVSAMPDPSLSSSKVVGMGTVPAPGNASGETAYCAHSKDDKITGSVAFELYTTPWTCTLALPTPMTAKVTRPYFHRGDIEEATYTLDREDLRGAPATPPAVSVGVIFKYRGVDISVSSVPTANGQALQFVPPGSLSPLESAVVVPESAASVVLQLRSSPQSLRTMGELAPGWKLLNDPPSEDEKQSGTIRKTLVPPAGRRQPFTASLVGVLPDKQEIHEGYQTVGYGDLPRTNLFLPAKVRIVPVDLKLPEHRRIAYLPGTGDAVPEALASIGMKPVMLSVADLTAEKLRAFDTVILGVRTYAAHPDLHGRPTEALLDYARAGGNVVVQYQTGEFTGDDAPYPLTLGNSAERVVDETDPVRLIEEPNDPAQRLLVVPNRIHPDDFNGWVEERGHGFLRSWDNHYSAPTETHDPGEDPQRGGLVTTQLGKGRWTYLAFAVYRQLPEAVPGAFRFFVNLLEKP